MKIKAIQHNYSGSAKPASKERTQQAINKAFVCKFFGVRANTPATNKVTK